MAKKIPTYDQQQLPTAEVGEAKVQYSMDDSAKAEAFGAQTLQETGKRMYWLSSDMFQLAKKEVEKRRAIEFSYARAQAMKEAARAAQDSLQAEPEKAAEIWEQSKQKVYSTIRNTLKDDEVAARFDEWWNLHAANLDIEVSAGIVERQNDIAIGKFIETATTYANEGNIDELKNLFADDTPPPGMKYTAYKKMQSEYMRRAIINTELAKIQADPQNYKLPEPNEYLDQKDIEYLEGQKNSEIRQIERALNQQSEDLAMDMIASYEETGRLKYSASDWTRLYRDGKINASWYTRGLSFIEETQKALMGKSASFPPEQELSIIDNYLKLALDPTTNLRELKASFATISSKLNNKYYKTLVNDIIKQRSDVEKKIAEGKSLSGLGLNGDADAVAKSYGLKEIGSITQKAWGTIEDMRASGVISPKQEMELKTDVAELAKLYLFTGTQEGFKPLDLETKISEIISKRALDGFFKRDIKKEDEAIKYISDMLYRYGLQQGHLDLATYIIKGQIDRSNLSDAELSVLDKISSPSFEKTIDIEEPEEPQAPKQPSPFGGKG